MNSDYICLFLLVITALVTSVLAESKNFYHKKTITP